MEQKSAACMHVTVSIEEQHACIHDGSKIDRKVPELMRTCDDGDSAEGAPAQNRALRQDHLRRLLLTCPTTCQLRTCFAPQHTLL